MSNFTLPPIPLNSSDKNVSSIPNDELFESSEPKVLLKRLKQYESSAHDESKYIFELKAKIHQLEENLKIEREWKARFMESFKLIQDYVKKSEADNEKLNRIDKENINNINKEFNSYKMASEQYKKDCMNSVISLKGRIEKIEKEAEEYRRQLLEHKSGISTIEARIEAIKSEYKKFKNEITDFRKDIQTRSEILSTIVAPASTGLLSTFPNDGETITITPQSLVNKLESVEVQFREEKRKRIQLEEKHQVTLRDLKSDYTKFKDDMTRDIEGCSSKLKMVIEEYIKKSTTTSLDDQNNVILRADEIESKLKETKSQLAAFDCKLAQEINDRTKKFKEYDDKLAYYNTKLQESEDNTSEEMKKLNIETSVISGKVDTNYKELSESFRVSESKYLAILRTQTKEMTELKSLVTNTESDLKISENHVGKLNDEKYNKKKVDEELKEIKEAMLLEQKQAMDMFEERNKEFERIFSRFDSQVKSDDSELGKCRSDIDILIQQNIDKYYEDDEKARKTIFNDVVQNRTEIETILEDKFTLEKKKRKEKCGELKKDVEILRNLLDQKAVTIEKNNNDLKKILLENAKKIDDITDNLSKSDGDIKGIRENLDQTQKVIAEYKSKVDDFETEDRNVRDKLQRTIDDVSRSHGTETKNYNDVFKELSSLKDNLYFKLKKLDDTADKLRAKKLNELPSDDEDDNDNRDGDTNGKNTPDPKNKQPPTPPPPPPPPQQQQQQQQQPPPNDKKNDKNNKKK